MTEIDNIPFQQILDALLDANTPFPARYLYRFSDLEAPELKLLSGVWSKVPTWRRKALMEDLEDLSEADTLLSFESIARFGADDDDPEVRLAAIHALWEYDEPRLAPVFLRLLQKDSDIAVRAAAASGLGQFIYLGELDKVSGPKLQEIEEYLIAEVNSDDAPQIRRNALESMGFSSRPEVPALIQSAFESGSKEWIASALLAMGRSADNERWEAPVLAMLESKSPLLRAEAARAAGELELITAASRLLELIDDPDDETRTASIWALSQVGGEGARRSLERLLRRADDDEEIAYIEAALDNLDFNEGNQLRPMFTFPDQDDGEGDDDLDEAYFDLLEEEFNWLEDEEDMDD